MGMRLCVWVRDYVYGHETVCMGMRLCVWVRDYVCGYETMCVGMRLCVCMGTRLCLSVSLTASAWVQDTCK